jgi:hypothetical protein
VIEPYLCELDAELRGAHVPARRRARLLAEVEDHLRTDPESLARFGEPAELAEGYAAEVRERRGLPASLVLLAATISFVLPLYAIPENTLPPAPAAGLPTHLHVLLDGALAALALAVAASVVAVLAKRVRPWAMAASVTSLAICSGFGLAAAALWPTARPLTYALAVPSATAVLAVAVASLAWAAWPFSRRIAISQT